MVKKLPGVFQEKRLKSIKNTRDLDDFIKNTKFLITPGKNIEIPWVLGYYQTCGWIKSL